MAKSPKTFTSHSPPRARTLSGPATRRRSTRELLQTRNRAFGPNGVPTTSRQTSATRTDTTSRLPISLGSTNKRYEPSTHLDVLERRPRDVSAQRIYNFSVARVVEDVERGNLQPWREPSNIACGQERFRLAAPRPVDAEHDPSRYDLLPIDTLKVSGQFFKTRFSVCGIGVPLVAVGRSE